jgi:hypothetical protein
MLSRAFKTSSEELSMLKKPVIAHIFSLHVNGSERLYTAIGIKVLQIKLEGTTGSVTTEFMEYG